MRHTIAVLLCTVIACVIAASRPRTPLVPAPSPAAEPELLAAREAEVDPYVQLRQAVLRGELEKVKGLLARHPQLLEKEYARDIRVPVLGVAVDNYRTELALFLIQAGADVHDERSIAYALCVNDLKKGEQRRIVESFLDHGLSARALVNGGVTLLEAAVHFKSPEAVEVLLEHGADPSEQLPRCVEDNNPELVRLLLAHGADPRQEDERGRTALEMAADKPAMLALLRQTKRKR